ncbi:MAG TPA: helix-turn-helix transcriptional regulator [Pararhizobium sp.]|nr:helix-turn-helix transcriptional regulator [Pararhizobium sp.]
MDTQPSSLGDHLRDWRRRRRMSQLDLAAEADISTRHLSFVETGRSQPSRDMVIRLAQRLEVPLRDRNHMLIAAGYAPAYPEKPLDDPDLKPAMAAIERLLAAHAPNPALAVDRHWTLLAANEAIAPLIAGAAPQLLEPPVNVLRLSLHPDGLAPRIRNLGEWRAHIIERLRGQAEATADPVLDRLVAELEAYPGRASTRRPDDHYAGLAVPLHIEDSAGRLHSFISTTTVFGAPLNVTLSEIAIESFLPIGTR